MSNTYDADLETAVSAVGLACRFIKVVLSSRPKPNVVRTGSSPQPLLKYAVQALLTRELRCSRFGQLKDSFVAPLVDSFLRLHDKQCSEVATLLEGQFGRFYFKSEAAMCTALELGRAKIPTGLGERCWVLDPIDSVDAAVAGRHFTVAVSLFVGGEQVLAVVGCPYLGVVDGQLDLHFPRHGHGHLFYAVKGQGAWMSPMAGKSIGDSRQIGVSTLHSDFCRPPYPIRLIEPRRTCCLDEHWHDETRHRLCCASV